MSRYGASEFQRILAFVRETRATRAEEVAIGKCTSWEAYQRDVAYIKAMDDVEEEMKTITGNQEALEEKDVT